MLLIFILYKEYNYFTNCDKYNIVYNIISKFY